MASAGGDGGRANPTGGRTQRFTIPLPRPLQPGQRVMVRMVPAVQVVDLNTCTYVRTYALASVGVGMRLMHVPILFAHSLYCVCRCQA